MAGSIYKPDFFIKVLASEHKTAKTNDKNTYYYEITGHNLFYEELLHHIQCQIANHKVFTTEERLITLEELRERWKGALPHEITKLANKGVLLPFRLEKTLQNPETKQLRHTLRDCYCHAHNPLDDSQEPIKFSIYDPYCVFFEKNILDIEKTYKEFLWDTVDDIDNASGNKLKYLQAENESLKAEIAALRAEKVEELEKAQMLARQSASQDSLELWGWVKVVYEMKKEGKTDKEIAESLQKKKISRPQIAILLYPDDNIIKDWGQFTDSLVSKS